MHSFLFSADDIRRVALVLSAQVDRLPPDHPAVRFRTLLLNAPTNGGATTAPQAPEIEDDDYWLKPDDEPALFRLVTMAS